MSIYGDWEGAIGRPLIFSFNFVHRRKALNVPEPLFPRHANLQEAITLTGSLKKSLREYCLLKSIDVYRSNKSFKQIITMIDYYSSSGFYDRFIFANNEENQFSIDESFKKKFT